MLSKTTISIKIDKELKQAAEQTARRVGLPLGTVVNGFLRNFVNEQRVEFSAPLVPNGHTRKLIERALKDYEGGNAVAFDSADAMDRWLESHA